MPSVPGQGSAELGLVLPPSLSAGWRCQGEMAGGVRAGGWPGTPPPTGGHVGTAPLTDAEQLLLLPQAGRALQTLEKPPGDMQDVVGVGEESFQVQLRQLRGTKMPQAKPDKSEVEQMF